MKRGSNLSVNSQIATIRKNKKPMSEQTFAILLLLPTLILITLLLVYPLAYSIYLSVYNVNVTKPWIGPQFVGLGNFITVIKSSEFWTSFGRTCYFGFFNVLFSMILGLALALLLNNKFKFRGISRGLLIIPWAIPGVVNGLLWQWIYNSDYGALNGILRQFGFIKNNITWLGSPSLAMNMLILADIWTVIPFVCLMYLAALQSIPSDMYEAGIVDGASWFQSFRYITLPMLRSMTLVLLVLRTIAVFKVFDIIYTLTKGGPANGTTVVGYYIYKQGFQFLDFGVSAAASYLLTFIILILVFVYIKVIGIEGEE